MVPGILAKQREHDMSWCDLPRLDPGRSALDGPAGLGWLVVAGERVNLATVRSVYPQSPCPVRISGWYVRAGTAVRNAGVGLWARRGVRGERWRWLDRPSAVADASYKPHRLTAVGDQCFAVALHTASREAIVDWCSRYGDLSYRVCAMPEQVRIPGVQPRMSMGLDRAAG